MFDIAVIALLGFFYYVGFFTPSIGEFKEFSGGVFIYRDFILYDRNPLSKMFADINEDVLDCFIDAPLALKFPMATLYQHGSDYLASSTRAARVSVGFFMRQKNERIEKFFKGELYKICYLPE